MEQSAFEQELAREKRARLTAERLLDQKQEELKAANRKLSDHALSLSGQIVDQRKVVQELEGENSKVTEDLVRANDKVVAVERLLWDALETIKDGFALFDADFRLIAANGPYLAALGHLDDIVPGVNFETILDLCIEEGIVDLRDQGEDAWFDQMTCRWDTAHIEPMTLRLWNGRYVKMMDRHTSDGGVVSLALDITDTMRREAELRDARDKAQAADRAKSAFLAKMSHELRTPMNGVVGMADLLLEGEQDEERTLYASTIRNSGEALLEIINDVLDFSKIEADKLELKPKPFDLEQIIQEVALIVDPSVQQKNMRFCVDYDQFLPTGFIGDPGRIRQIITNLVGNAVKFTEEGHVLVRVVGLTLQDEANCQINITIEDTGIGIDEGKLDHVFGEFNQVEDEANRKYEGTGLGLAISRRLVEQMGGEVWVDSVKGEGSCFGFSLVLPVSSDVPAVPLPDLARVRTAVVLDTHRVNGAILAQQLENMGLEAKHFDSLAEANDTLSGPGVDVIFATPEFADQGIAEDNVIWIDEAPTKDAIVLRLPVMRSALREALAAYEALKAEDAPQVAREIPVVLAAEDNKTNQLVFKTMLKGLKIELVLVDNGLKAVESFKDLRPDIVFTDISMPEMDGMEAAETIRAFEAEQGLANVPIVAMTAHAMDGDEARIRKSGIDHYLTKPLKKDLIHEALRTLLRNGETVFEEAG